ncbi:hypothetical protein [Actinophytocola sp.]|uniref:hypothetical protein n=1 Tax=Actinophytocola sp. TaxID=1872138 RepID=UPI003D6AE280
MRTDDVAMHRGGWAKRRDELLVASRDGAIKAATLVSLGVPERTVYRRCVPGGPWRRLLPGVVLLSDAAPTWRQQVSAALLYGGPDAIVTGVEACRRHGLVNVPDERRVHLLVPHGRKVHGSDYVIVERTVRMPESVTRHDVPVAPLDRAVLDTCRRLRAVEPVSALVSEAVQRGRVRPGWLRYEMERGSRRGTAVVREVLKDIEGGARSIAEADAMRVWARTGLPTLEWNVVLRCPDGRYIATPDGWADEVGMAWEIDSFAFHFSRDDYARTVARNSRYAAAGVVVVQTLPTRLRSEPDAVTAELRAAYRAAAARPRPAGLRLEGRHPDVECP